MTLGYASLRPCRGPYVRLYSLDGATGSSNPCSRGARANARAAIEQRIAAVQAVELRGFRWQE